MFDLRMFDLVVILIVAFPLVAAAVNGVNLLCGDRFHYTTVQRLTCGSILLSFIGSVWVFAQVLADPAPREVTVYRWLFSGDLNVNVAFLIDSLSGIMMLVVTGFSFLISVFSINYMHADRSFTRYFTAFGLFVFAMLVLVMGNNYVMLFVGWESVGVCSYLMIGHYYERKSAAQAGTAAFVMNRVGDAGFLIGIFLIATHFKTVNYAEVFAKLNTIDSATATAICLSLLMGAVGKSAQLPLGTWLSKAMEGPTPSSALIHAATMVTAGVYMIVRSHALYDMAPNALLVVAIIGAATALYGAAVGLTLPDIKGILAASTTTQLGLMFFACGLGAYAVAIFHLVAHAFLKSYLFLTAPSILHHMHTRPDVTKTEKAKESIPLLYFAALLGAVGLVLFPFLPGVRPSDVAAAATPYYVLLAGGVMAAVAAAYYAVKMTKHVFYEDAHGEHGAEAHASPLTMVGPVVVLAGAAAIGFWLGLLPGGVENTWFKELLAPMVAVQALPPGGHPILAYTLLGLIVLMLVSAWFSAPYFQRFKPEMPGLALLKMRGLYSLAANRFWLEEIYDRFAIQACQRLGRLLDRLDTGVIDRIVGTPAPAARVPGAATWEEQYLVMRATAPVSETTGVAGWLAKVGADTTSWAEKEVVGQATGVMGGMTEAAAAFAGGMERKVVGRATGVMGGMTQAAAATSGWVEREVIGHATGVLGGVANVAAAFSAWMERNVFGIAGAQRGVFDRGLGKITELTAAFAHWVERHVFDRGVHTGMPLASGVVGRALVRMEEVIGHPLMTGSLLVASVVALLLGVFS